jgi:hypothetical protein
VAAQQGAAGLCLDSRSKRKTPTLQAYAWTASGAWKSNRKTRNSEAPLEHLETDIDSLGTAQKANRSTLRFTPTA